MNRDQVRVDLFPAIVVIAPPEDPPASSFQYPNPVSSPGTRLLQKARVIVTLDSVYVFTDSPQGPKLVFRDKLEDYVPPAKQPPVKGTIAQRAAAVPQATLVTDSGKTLAFHRATGCSTCGSRLKGFNPFPQMTQHASTSDQ